MWRDDHLYDVVGVLDWNLRPRVRGKGSAIFLHLARPGYAPTAGCIALQPRHLALLLAAAGPRPEFLVAAKPRRLEANGKLARARAVSGLCFAKRRAAKPFWRPLSSIRARTQTAGNAAALRLPLKARPGVVPTWP